MSEPMIIAIDGPSGSGKSSVSRAVAKEFDFNYLDTGSMYRAVTWHMLTKGIDVHDAAAVAKEMAHAHIIPSTDPDHPGISVGTSDVSQAIRQDDVTNAVSAVSAVPEVRTKLVELQRTIAHEAARGIVVEGRDITNVVLPDAQIKIFLTADPVARAARRAAEASADVQATQERLLARDKADSSRAASPFVQTPDAMELDTTHLNLDEVVDFVVRLVRDATQ